jgi:DNA ligase (NAD+)
MTPAEISLCTAKSNQATSMTGIEISAIAARLAAAAHAYHNGLELLMTDDEFDAGVESLRAAAPTHPFLAQVGAPVAAGDEVALPIPLPSLNKIKPDGSLEKWLARYPAAKYHVSTKLDGCSALWIPATRQLFTRGDGMRGRDISAFAPHIQGLLVQNDPIVTERLQVRGELIMRTDSPAVPAGKLARNIVAGALNRKAAEVDPAQLREIRFVAYGLEAPVGRTPEEAFRILRMVGYEVARATCMEAAKMTPALLSETFSTVEKISSYQLDGIVVAPNIARPPTWKAEVRKGVSVNPDDRVAWKTRVSATSARTTVRAVEWNISVSGMLIPRVLFDTVSLAGANIGAATGLHGRWIFDNVVGPDAVIEVRRAGDVIPQIIAVHTPAPAGPAMPAAGYEWDGPSTTAVHVRPTTGSMDAESTCIRLTRALGELGAENVGAGVVAKLHAAGYDTICKIYAATAADFAARVEGCKEKMAERIYAGLRFKQASWTELTLMLASCTMPRGVGNLKLQPLLAIEPQPARWSAAALTAARPAGLSAATIEAIVAAVPAYLAWRAENIQGPVAPTPAPSPLPPPSHTPAKGAMVVVMTGVRDKALEAALTAAGHTIADAVTKKTTHLVHPDGPTPTTGKAAKAQELGATIMTLTQFRALL